MAWPRDLGRAYDARGGRLGGPFLRTPCLYACRRPAHTPVASARPCATQSLAWRWCCRPWRSSRSWSGAAAAVRWVRLDAAASTQATTPASTPAAASSTPAAASSTPAAASSTPAAATAALTGKWSGTYSGTFTGTFTLTWTESSGKLTGTIDLSTSGTVPLNGTVAGNQITFGTVGSTAVTYAGTCRATRCPVPTRPAALAPGRGRRTGRPEPPVQGRRSTRRITGRPRRPDRRRSSAVVLPGASRRG